MNSSHLSSASTGLPHDRFALHRYRVCRLSQNGEINRRVTATDFYKSVAAARRRSPLRLGSQQKAIVAAVEWIDEPTTFGTKLRVRTNQFHDEALAGIARHLCQRTEIRHAIVHGIAI